MFRTFVLGKTVMNSMSVIWPMPVRTNPSSRSWCSSINFLMTASETLSDLSKSKALISELLPLSIHLKNKVVLLYCQQRHFILIENFIIHAIQLSCGQPGEGRYPGQYIKDDLSAEICSSDVQLSQWAGLVPLCLADLLPDKACLLQHQTGEVLAALQ